MVIRNSLLGERCTLGLACRYLRMHGGRRDERMSCRQQMSLASPECAALAIHTCSGKLASKAARRNVDEYCL